MVMESKDIQSDLRALKKLYGLIRNDRDETTNTDLLDEHSRLVLKNLLDAATKKVLLKLQSESEVEDEQSAPRSRLSSTADTKMDGLDASLLKEKGEQSTPIVPASGSHKLCTVCQRNTVKQKSIVVQNSNKFTDPQKNECDGYLENKKQEMCASDVDCHSREAVEGVKQIELCISGLHIERGADQLHPFDNNGDQSCSLLCHIPTQRDTDPMFLLFQPTKAIMLGQSRSNYIRQGLPFSPASKMGSLYQGHTVIEDEHRHLRTYKPSTYMNMINSENRHQESDEETSTSDSEDGSREAEYVNSSRSSGSWGTPRSQYSGYTSNGEEEVYSSSSRDEAPQLTFSSSSKTSEGYSSYEEPTRIRSYAKKSGPKACGVNHMKQSGIWNKLKERLSIIFHHHHHNHGDRRKMARGATLDKQKGKEVDFIRRYETHGEKAVEKRKSLVHHSHFHGLVQGLLRHVQHSKQAKSGKHSRKKNLNKSHWWQLLQHHRGAQLHHHRKLGLGKEKGHVC